MIAGRDEKELSAEDFFNTGVELSSQQDYEGAIQKFSIAISLDPQYADAYLKRGVATKNLIAYNKSSDYQSAIDDFNKAIELNPDNPVPHNHLAMLMKKLGSDQGVIDEYTKAIETPDNPNKGFAYFQRGNVKFKSGDKQGACEDWKKAAELGFDLVEPVLKEHCE